MTVHQDAEPRIQTDVREQVFALTHACGWIRPELRSKIVLTGTDRVRWLNGMVTNNVRDLAPGHGVYAFVLSPQGRILGDLYIFNRGESLLIDTDQSQAATLLALFDRYIIMDEVEVAEMSTSFATVEIAGPKALPTLRAAGFELPPDGTLRFVDSQWRGFSVTVARGDNPLVENYEISAPPTAMQAIETALQESGGARVSEAAMEQLRIASGLPRYGQDIRERDLPQETEQARALNFSKGCYVGQEIVERIRSQGRVHRRFSGFIIDGPSPEPGAKLRRDEKDVGEITSATSLPFANGELNVALGYVRREAIASDVPLDLGSAKATAVPLPFRQILTQ